MRHFMYAKKKSHIHFIGIGGIGMSGIAKILAHQGYHISGCDVDCDQKSIHDLRDAGCTIYQGNNTPECHNQAIDIVVYSSAIQLDNPEIIAAQQRGIPTIARALMLAELMRTKYSVAITGAHGKTTTTSLIAHMMIETHQDPTVIIGGHLTNLSTNARFGRGAFLIAEADESDRSFLRLYPTFAVVTNIDLEHLDTYQDLSDIIATFKQFLSNIPFYGKAFVCYDDPHIRSFLPELTHIKTVKYGLTSESDCYATDIILEADHSRCSVWYQGVQYGTILIPMPGIHNVYNTLAALAVMLELELPFEECISALAHFKGIDRRFSFKGYCKGAEVFDDYGHHPTEIRHTLTVARKRARNKLIVAFQPHRFTRTQGLWHQFLDVLKNSAFDHLIITDIYPASEEPIAGITSDRMVEELQALMPMGTISYVAYDQRFEALQQKVLSHITPNDLLLTLGAGKMNKLAELLCKKTL